MLPQKQAGIQVYNQYDSDSLFGNYQVCYRLLSGDSLFMKAARIPSTPLPQRIGGGSKENRRINAFLYFFFANPLFFYFDVL
jgi:hypothetical protein